MAFDRHMNLVLGDSEEFRKLPPKKGRSEEEVTPLPIPPPFPRLLSSLSVLSDRSFMCSTRVLPSAETSPVFELLIQSDQSSEP